MEMDLELLSCFCDEAQDLLVRWEGLCLEMSKNHQPAQFDELFRLAHNLKGSSRVVGLESFGNLVHRVEDGITVLKKGQIQISATIIQKLLKAQELLLNWITELKKDPNYEVEYQHFLEGYADVFLAHHQGTSTETVVPSMPVQESPVAVVEEVHPEPAAPVEAPVAVAAQKRNPTPRTVEEKKINLDETVRVSARKIEQLLEIMGELSIHQSVIFHSLGGVAESSSQLNHSSYLARKITRDLYEKTLSLRMVPVQPVFQRLERSIRELAGSLGKEVDVEVTGGEVELDKTVCEKIVEPLTHMVRNSIDHGIENPDVRLAAGKPAGGKVKINAVQDSSAVHLWIEDDGKGLNEEKIRARAIANGIIKPDTHLEPSEVFALIFLPGFSTAEKVTDVSGRGVGMDVVMRTVESLKGEIKIGSVPGKGTQFRISIPTTLSIIDALIVNLRGVEYAIPVSAVDEILHLNEFSYDENDKMIRVHQRIIPVYSLAECMNTKGANEKIKHKSMLISRFGNERVAFKVDHIIEQQQIVVRKFAPGMEHVFGLAGGTILGNGQPGLIVDLKSLAEHFVLKVKPKAERAA
jgi:two-component system chemotaxis sensor kinase CheA